MNKKGKGFGTLVSIIFIFIVVLILLNFLGINIWKVGKTALGLTDTIELVNYTIKNDEAEKAFDNLIKDIKKCEKSSNEGCFCDASLNKFYITHLLRFTDTEGSLRNIKEGNDIVISKENIDNLNCYFKNLNDYEKEDTLNIIFKEKIRIYRGDLNSDWEFLKDDFEFIYDYFLYKNDNSKVCWLTDEVNADDVKNKKPCSEIN